MKRLRVLLPIALIIFTLCLMTSASINVSAQGAYRRLITITSGQYLSNYTIRIELNATNFDTWDHVTENGSDIYFTDSDGNPLYYWIANFNKTAQQAIIYVKVPTITTDSGTTICMYYGGSNPYIAHVDPDNMFLFFDDFEGTSLNTSKWEEIKSGGTSYLAVNNSMLEIHNDGTNRAYARSISTFSAPYILEFKAKMVENFEVSFHWNGILTGSAPDDSYQYYYSGFSGRYSPPRLAILKRVSGDASYLDYIECTLDTGFHLYKVVTSTSGIKCYLDSSLIVSTSDTTYLEGYIGLSGREQPAGIVTYYDWILIRPYADPEPSYEIGPEEVVGLFFYVKPLDLDGNLINYLDLKLQVINATGNMVREYTGKGTFCICGIAEGNYTLKLQYGDIIVGIATFELNATTTGSTVELLCTLKKVLDYRGLNKSIVYELDKQLLKVENLNAKYPYSIMRVVLNGSGSFKLYIDYGGKMPTKINVVSNISISYSWNETCLTINGTLTEGACELNVTDLYKLVIETYDRLGTPLDWIYVLINGTKHVGSFIERYLYPEDYIIELPQLIRGFRFFAFSDGFNQSIRAVTINNTDIMLKAWYKIPASISVKCVRVSSTNETIDVYLEGYLKDYYGGGVANRIVNITVTNIETGYVRFFNVTTDINGHFVSPIARLAKNKTYEIKVMFNGDDIYVAALTITKIKPDELPSVVEIPVTHIVVAIGVLVIIIAVLAVMKAFKHTVCNVCFKKRFVKKKY